MTIKEARKMKRTLVLLFAIFSIVSLNTYANDTKLRHAFEGRQNDLQIKGAGTVVRLLPDDNKGSRHQKFILELKSKQTLLVAHNIDLAPRVEGLVVGDRVQFFGEYEWNKRGGVIHWTHHDPRNQHAHGWLIHRGKKYH